MPDRWGRPTFQDGMSIAQGVMGLDQTLRQREREQEQDLLKEQTAQVSNYLASNPDALGQDLSEVPEFKEYDPKALHLGRAAGAKSLMAKAQMDATNLKLQKAKSEQDAMEATKLFQQAKAFHQKGGPENERRAAELLGQAYGYFPDGHRAKVADTSSYNPTNTPDGIGPAVGREEQPALVFESPRGNLGEKPMPVDEAISFIEQNPEMLAPETFFKQHWQTMMALKEENLENIASPETLTGKNGETVYRTKKEHPDKPPTFIISDKPLYDPNHKVLSMEDAEGKFSQDEWARFSEIEEQQLENQKTMAETQKTRAETDLIKRGTGGGGESAPASVQESEYIVRFLKDLPENKGLSEPQLRMKAYQLATSRANKSPEQFVQEYVMMQKKDPWNETPDEELVKQAYGLIDLIDKGSKARGSALGSKAEEKGGAPPIPKDPEAQAKIKQAYIKYRKQGLDVEEAKKRAISGYNPTNTPTGIGSR